MDVPVLFREVAQSVALRAGVFGLLSGGLAVEFVLQQTEVRVRRSTRVALRGVLAVLFLVLGTILILQTLRQL